jgi:hypothetical protein
MRRTAVRFLGVGLALSLAGCALFRGAPLPEAEPIPIAADDPLLTALVRGWDSVTESRRSLRAGVVLKLSGADGERRLSQNVVVARPDRIRMEIQAFLTTAAVLVADGTRYDYFESFHRYRERGPVYPHLLWEIAGVPLTLDQAVSFLLGGPPARGRRVRSLRFAPEGELLHAEEWGPDERLRWSVGYDRYRDVGGEPFAHSIGFDFPRYRSEATITFRSVVLNPETPDTTFELNLPDDGSAG